MTAAKSNERVRRRPTSLRWLPLELFGAWRYASSRCSSTSCSFCNPPRELVIRSAPAIALASDHGARRLW